MEYEIFIKSALVVSEYYVVQEGNDIHKFGLPQGERILSMSRQYQYSNGRNFGEFLQLDTWHNDKYIRIYGWSQHKKKLIKITPPQEKRILITIRDSNNIIELLCSSIRFGAYRSFQKNLNDDIENLYLSDLEYLDPNQKLRFPNLIERLVNIHQFDERVKWGEFSQFSFEKNDDNKLFISKIEVYETEYEIASRLINEKVYFSSGYNFRKSVIFEKNVDSQIIINSEDRTATISTYNSYEEWKKCGWDGTLLCDFRDENKHIVFFRSYNELCRTFKIKPIRRIRNKIKYKFPHKIEFLNALYIYIKDPESP